MNLIITNIIHRAPEPECHDGIIALADRVVADTKRIIDRDDWISLTDALDLNLWIDDADPKRFHGAVYPVVKGSTDTRESLYAFGGDVVYAVRTTYRIHVQIEQEIANDEEEDEVYHMLGCETCVYSGDLEGAMDMLQQLTGERDSALEDEAEAYINEYL